MAMNINDAQTEAMRRKAQGDNRPLPLIIQEIMNTATDQIPQEPDTEAYGLEVTPTPATPVPVGQPVQVRAEVPPMVNPFAVVDKARQIVQETSKLPADINATDAAIKSAEQKGRPAAGIMERASDMVHNMAQQEAERIADIRKNVGIDPAEEAILKAREDRYAQLEAQIAKDEKKQAWNALAMAGFRMAQSSSPYFAAALSEGLQAGLEGYNASKAATAEKKARLADAKESIALDRIRGERSAEERSIADVRAAQQAVRDRLALQGSAAEQSMASELFPLKKQAAELDIASSRQVMALRAAERGGATPVQRLYGKYKPEELKFAQEYAKNAAQGYDAEDLSKIYPDLISEGQTIFRQMNTPYAAAAAAIEGAPVIRKKKQPDKEQPKPFSLMHPSTW